MEITRSQSMTSVTKTWDTQHSSQQWNQAIGKKNIKKRDCCPPSCKRIVNMADNDELQLSYVSYHDWATSEFEAHMLQLQRLQLQSGLICADTQHASDWVKLQDHIHPATQHHYSECKSWTHILCCTAKIRPPRRSLVSLVSSRQGLVSDRCCVQLLHFCWLFLLKIDSTGTHTEKKIKQQLHLAYKLTTGVASDTLTKATMLTRIDGLFFIFESSFFVFRSRALMERALIGLIGQLFEGHPVSFLCVSNANTHPISELRRWAHVSFKCDQLNLQSRNLCSQSLGVQTFWRFSWQDHAIAWQHTKIESKPVVRMTWSQMTHGWNAYIMYLANS